MILFMIIIVYCVRSSETRFHFFDGLVRVYLSLNK